jgi:hypothetical protein
MTQNPKEKSARIRTNGTDGRLQWRPLGQERYQRASIGTSLTLTTSAKATRMTGKDLRQSQVASYGKCRLQV